MISCGKCTFGQKPQRKRTSNCFLQMLSNLKKKKKSFSSGLKSLLFKMIEALRHKQEKNPYVISFFGLFSGTSSASSNPIRKLISRDVFIRSDNIAKPPKRHFGLSLFVLEQSRSIYALLWMQKKFWNGTESWLGYKFPYILCLVSLFSACLVPIRKKIPDDIE